MKVLSSKIRSFFNWSFEDIAVHDEEIVYAFILVVLNLACDANQLPTPCAEEAECGVHVDG